MAKLLRRSTLTLSLRKRLRRLTFCSTYQQRRPPCIKRRDDTTMPSRKFSVNSQFSTSSQKTSGSSSNGMSFYRRTASVHQINELYAALNDLIQSPPVNCRRDTGGSSASSKSQWSSEGNLLEYKGNIVTRTASGASQLRTARSASCLSSKSCYASIAVSKNTNVGAKIAVKKLETSRGGGVYSKIMAKLRGRKSRDKGKSRKQSTEEVQMNSSDEIRIQTIEDLIELASSKSSKNSVASAKEKRRKFKAEGRRKADSFDSCDSNMPNICVHEVSSKLKTWYTRAASYAATIEDEERSRAESSCAGSAENFLESSGYESKGDATNAEVTTDDELIVRDFDVSTPDMLDDMKSLDTMQEEGMASHVSTLERKALNDLKPIRPKLSLKRTCSAHQSIDDVFENDELMALSKTLWKSENRCDMIRRLSLTIVEDVLTGKSASCEQISNTRLNRDRSRRKVQQWLKDLNVEDQQDDTQKYDDGKINLDRSDHDNRELNSEGFVSAKASKYGHRETDIIREIIQPFKEPSLLEQPVFYIPNIGETEQTVNMVVPF